MIIINAENLIVGRLATIAAKQTLMGQEVAVINSDKAYISGKRAHLTAEFIRREAMGTHKKGPHFPRQAHMIMKRIIRGMIPYKESRGKEAFARLKCYNGIPKEFEGKEYFTLPANTNISKLPNLNYVSLGEVSKLLGARR